MPDETYFKSPDGEWERHYGCVFDRGRIFVCRRCGAMVDNQLASHAVMHKDLDGARDSAESTSFRGRLIN